MWCKASFSKQRFYWSRRRRQRADPKRRGKPVAAVAERAEVAGFVTVAPPRRLAGCEAWVGSGRAAPRGAARSGGRLGAGGPAGGAGTCEDFLAVECGLLGSHCSDFYLFCVGKGTCPNEQAVAASHYSRSEWNKCHSYSGTCQRLTAGSSAGARWAWGRGQGCASKQAKQKELTHGSE